MRDIEEAVARALHEAWLRQRLEVGEEPASRPSLVGWETLPDEFKESSLRTARHMSRLVELAGYEIVPWTGEGDVLTHAEVERLAREVHEHWVEERRAEPWRLVASGDEEAEARRRADLVPWEALSEKSREIDRHLVRGLPRLLAATGRELRRPA